MRNRQPAVQQMDPVYGRTLRTLNGSPAERLGPPRPPARPRRHRLDREQRSASPLLRVLSGLFTFALLLMLLVGGLSYHISAGGSGHMSGSVFGKTAGEEASAQIRRSAESLAAR